MLRVLSVVLLLLLPIGSRAETGPRPAAADLEALITRTMRDWQVPGTAVAIVRGEDVLLVKGFGYRDVENKKPVTPRTQFRLASVTKSFTAAGVAALVTQGKLEWNRPVRETMPEFRLYTDALTERVTPLDLLSHRTGLPRHDSVWYYNRELPREEMIRRLRYLEPNKDLREAWQYSNFMFLVAGYLTGRVLNTTWEEAVARLLFKPLAMSDTNSSIDEMEQSRDHAEPYQKDKQEVVQKVPNNKVGSMGPVGMINSTAEDMSHYLSMLINGGRYRGRQVLASADVQKMTTAQMPVGPSDPRYPEMGEGHYGLGLSVTTFRGHRMVHHDGALDGFRSHLAFLPDDKLGIMVLSNLGRTNFPVALSHELFDRLLDLPPANWGQRYFNDEQAGKAAEKEAEGKGYSPRKSGTHPSHPLAEYAGHYEHPAYGVIEIGSAGEQLRIHYGHLDVPLAHFHYDSFEFLAVPVPETKLRLRFETDGEGEIAGLSVPFEPLAGPIVFTRVADPRMRNPAFLKALTGEYELGNSVLSIVLREDQQLLLVQPTGQTLMLDPLRGTTFRVKERAGWSVEFKRAADGTVSEAALYTATSSLLLRRKP